ncbi:AbiTii domain-containing protein [Corynebacterium sp. S7]
MPDSLLLSIRSGLIEGRPLPDLLRACIFLGSDTNSQLLQDWARKELEGYPEDEDAEVPEYRTLEYPPVFATLQAGNQFISNTPLSPFNVPEKAREYYPENLYFTQPLQTLMEFSLQEKAVKFLPGKLLMVRDIYNNKYAPLNQILEISVNLDKSYFSGIVDRIRTVLSSMIADLTKSNPMETLPSSERVDRVVKKYIENHYDTRIEQASGPVAIGSNAQSIQNGLKISELVDLIKGIDLGIYELEPDQRRETEAELERVSDELQAGTPNKGVIRSIFDKIRGIGARAGDAAFTGAMEELGSTVIETLG